METLLQRVIQHPLQIPKRNLATDPTCLKVLIILNDKLHSNFLQLEITE